MYLFIAFLDTLHALAYTGMGVFQGYDSNLPTQIWIFTRYIESISLAAATFIIYKKINTSFIFLGYSVTVIIFLLSIFYWKIFPASYIEGTGLTQFKIISEYIISAILVAAILLMFRKLSEFDKKVFRLIVAAMIITVLSEISFTFYEGVFDIPNLIGHHLKIVSFFLIYKAILETSIKRPFDVLFRKISSLARFPSENPNPVLRIDSRLRIIYSNLAGQKMLIDYE